MTGGDRRLLAGSRAAMLAGWLFADLLLVLFITAVASLPPPIVKVSGTKTHHHVKHNPRPKPRVLERKPHTIYVNVPPAEVSDPATHRVAVEELLSKLHRQLAAQGLLKQQAGFVLVFASGPVGGISQAISTAKSVLVDVRAKEKEFSHASGVGYWRGNGDFEFKIFFFA